MLAAARRGDALRRCSLPDEGPRGSEIVANLNWLLDQRSPPEDPGEEDEDAATRRALLALLDGLVEQPALLLGPASQLIGTNAAALGDNVAKLAEEAMQDLAMSTFKLRPRAVKTENHRDRLEIN